jgi:hypothetical protein
MMESQLLQKYFVGKDGFYWWIGQIVGRKSWQENITANPTPTNASQPGFGERYKVRILGYHPQDQYVLDDQNLPWAHVMYPVTGGGGNQASWQSANLRQGNFVFGFYLDGEDGQQPVIMGVIGNNSYQYVASQPNSQWGFRSFSGFGPTDTIPDYALKEEPKAETAPPPPDGVGGPNGENVLLPGNYTIYEGIRYSVNYFRDENGELREERVAPIDGRADPTQQELTEFQRLKADLKASDKSKVCSESPDSSCTTEVASTTEADDGTEEDQLRVVKECKSEMAGLSKEIQKTIKGLERLKKSIYSKQANIAKDTAEFQQKVEKWLDKRIEKIMEMMNTFLGRLSQTITRNINEAAKNFYTLLFPNERESAKKAIETGNDLIICLIKKIVQQLIGTVRDFLIGAGNKVINVASCLVNDFLGEILRQIAGLINSVISQALGAFNSLVGGVVGIIGSALDIIIDLLSFLSCDDRPECAPVDEWSAWAGAGAAIYGDMQGLFKKVSEFPGQVSDTLSADNFNFDLDIGGMFNPSKCFTGPIACGPPLAQFFGGSGAGAAVNLIISGQGEVIGGEVVNAGIGYLTGTTKAKVVDQCGKGRGAVIRPIIGPVIVGDTTASDPTGEVADGTMTTGIVDIEIVQSGAGYLPSPDGSVGGSGRTWAENDETIVQHDNGDYEVPIPPGNRVCVVAGDSVTLPVGTTVVTEPNSDSGGGEEILGGVPHIMKSDGCLTTPPLNRDSLRGPEPSLSTGAYPAVLYLCEIIIDNPGKDYLPGDNVIIEPKNGASASVKFDRFGRVESIKVTNGGEGFTTLPEIYIETTTGYNAKLRPRLCIDRIGENIDKPMTGDLVTVVDCVGKF